MSVNEYQHIPVLLEEVLAHLPGVEGVGDTIVDATFGFGGYSRAVLKSTPFNVIGIDQDPDVRPKADQLAKNYKDRFTFIEGNFAQLDSMLPAAVWPKVRGVVFDIGVSSYQLDNGERGFSFQKEAPLDMRMSREGTSAADVINTYEEQELADIFYKFGDEKKSRRIAKKIVLTRGEAPLETTTQLAQLVASCYPGGYHKTHPATKVFQALRIYVNNELDVLVEGLKGVARNLAHGRIVVVTFHSLEDRITKNLFRELAQAEEFKLVTRKPILPSEEETKRNPRARSAKLRVLEKRVSL